MLRLFAFLFLIGCLAVEGTSQKIKQAEYFIDTDPGYGSGIAVDVTQADSTVYLEFPVLTNDLTIGFHRLYFRVFADSILLGKVYDGGNSIQVGFDTLSIWLNTEQRLFYVDLDQNIEFVSSAEFYLDHDPGYGSAISVDVNQLDDFSSLSKIIATDTITPGFHKIHLRAQTSTGKWGIVEQRLIFVDNLNTNDSIANLELFFDIDPGYGNGASIGNFENGTLVSIEELLATDTLNPGFHTLYMRAQTQAGQWGIVEQRLVFVDQGGSIDVIAYLEVFFDHDPGYGQGIEVGQFEFENLIAMQDSLSSDSLTTGFHTFFLRAQTEGGQWGMAEPRLVFVDQIGGIDPVAYLEAFFDIDPGYGSGFEIGEFDPDNLITIQDFISTDTLSSGFHTLYMRAQTQAGQWGIAEQRLVFIDQSGALDPVSYLEVFFDTDPGYGSGFEISEFDMNNLISVQLPIPTDSLSTGFHTLFLRAKTDGGQWGIAEQRLVYVDDSGSIIGNITAFEYFFDTDPGYGLATQIPVGTPDESIIRNFLVATNALTPGRHVLVVRPKDEFGSWGIPETHEFQAFDPGRELDSLSLRVFYQSLNGANWTARNNWLNTTIDNWFGVKVNNGRVDSLQLSANNLTGKLPFQLGYLSALSFMDLSENNISDTIPGTFTGLTTLETLRINGNQLHELPNLSTIAGLTHLSVDDNYFDFGDLEKLVEIENFTYTDQQIYNDQAYDSIVAVGSPITLDVNIRGTANQYQWYLNDQAILGADLKLYPIDHFNATDTGSYQLSITNTLLPDLEMKSALYSALLSQRAEDSLAMVSLYLSTNGDSWNRKSGWLFDPLDQWEGLVIENDRLVEVALAANQLSGTLPADLVYAEQIRQFNIGENSLKGEVPDTYGKLINLTDFLAPNNELTGLPAFNLASGLEVLDVRENKLQFADLELNLAIPQFLISPQKIVTDDTDTLVERLSNPELLIQISGANNQYQWFKNDEIIAGANSPTLVLQEVDFLNEGLYRVDVTNTIVTGLTLQSGNLELRVSSLRRDSLALRTLYDSTAGDNWSLDVNWLTAPIREWDGVTVGDERVTAVDLSNGNVNGEVPRIVRDITSLKNFNLNNNQVQGLPNMSQMPNLENLDVRSNLLNIDDIEINLPVEGFLFNPQRQIPVNQQLLVANQGTDVLLSFNVSGQNNEYEWYLNETFIQGAFNSSYLIDSISLEKMGFYVAESTSPKIRAVDPDFRLVRQPQRVLAKARLYGVADGVGGVPLESGELNVFRIPEAGGKYDTTATVSVINGVFEADSLILGNYTTVTSTDDSFYIPTYYGDTEDWILARTINLVQDFQITDYNLLFRPEDPTGGEGLVDLTVESEIEGEEDGRIENRRRVRKAGCSLRRRTTGAGRPEEDVFVLVAYKETDDNGQVSFGTLPVGYYRLNIQYPGIPMDPTSFIEFEITEAEADIKYVLSAVVTEDAIVVELIEALSTNKKYFVGLNVYPNPAAEQFTIQYSKLMSEQVRVALMDINGREITNIPIEKGKNKSIEMDVSAVPDGIYFLNFYDARLGSKPLSVFKVILRK